MGLYVEKLSTGAWLKPLRKADQLIADGATEMPHPQYGPFTVCVVENGPFDAAGFCYSRREFVSFLNDLGGRRARWLTAEAACRANFSPDTLEEHLKDVAGGPPVPMDLPPTPAERRANRERLEALGFVVIDLDDLNRLEGGNK